MKKLFFIIAVGLSVSLNGQVLTPKASPVAKLQQKVGLADIQIDYSRPGAKGRVIFGDLIPYGQMWRLGANENTKVTTSEALIFGKDTIQAKIVDSLCRKRKSFTIQLYSSWTRNYIYAKTVSFT